MAFSDFYSFNLRYSLPYFSSLSFYDKKKFSSKKEQKTIDASEKVSFLTDCKNTWRTSVLYCFLFALRHAFRRSDDYIYRMYIYNRWIWWNDQSPFVFHSLVFPWDICILMITQDMNASLDVLWNAFSFVCRRWNQQNEKLKKRLKKWKQRLE